jgi:DNA-directed RNA polymerase alpha subunit/DNA-directed RNA polymerase subunit L
MAFSGFKKSAQNENAYTFTLAPINVSYANTLRRIILTGVETAAFRSDMTSTGSTTHVAVKHNDTPMTNEMLADRIGLLPIHITTPLTWKGDDYTFTLDVKNDSDSTRYVTASDFKVVKNTKVGDEEKDEDVTSHNFFPVNPLTGETALIAALQPRSGTTVQRIELTAKASKGTGREHARFSPVSQCSYEYTVDTDPERLEDMFFKWVSVAKKIENMDKKSEKYEVLMREFNTMQRKRCFLINEKGEPYSFDFTVETVGVLPVPYIVRRACEVAENMCSMYVNLDKSIPSEVTITSTDSRIIGYDFLFRGHDHTLGNLLQTWLVENHIEGNATPKITYAGYSIPHPLRDEMLLRVGVEDDEERTARNAVAAAAKGCVEMFKRLRLAWDKSLGVAPQPASIAKPKPKPSQRAPPQPTVISSPAVYPKEIQEQKEVAELAPVAPVAPSVAPVAPVAPVESLVAPVAPIEPSVAPAVAPSVAPSVAPAVASASKPRKSRKPTLVD